MPGGVPYIICNEVAERFSFYGMKAILVVFMSQYLWLMGDAPGVQMTETTANAHYHSFNKWVYLTPFIGALLADIIFGKYKIIIWFSLIYCVGHACLAFMGITGSAGWWLFGGLALICLGAGGIKPCVSAHVGDQFGKQNQGLLAKVFNFFYFGINLGSFVSTLLTPWLLEWYGPHWAFGVPGVLMGLATLFFWMGRNKFIHVQPDGERFKQEAFGKEGISVILRLLPLYFFVAFFWALFDQTGSSWIFQSQDMDRTFMGIEWLPSQIQAINPVLILTLVPIFSFVIYPAIGKVVKLTPLRKIGAGLFLTVISFAIIAMIQISIAGGATPNIGWQLLAYLVITAAEVLVSIVCLEYSYTQAPKNMKSLIMAVFFLSVSFGNYITESVNSAIEVENPTAGLIDGKEKKDGSYVHPGFDGKQGTDDDITLIKEKEKLKKTLLPGQETLDAAAKIITDWAVANDLTLPTTEEAAPLIADLKDQWGSPLIYNRLASRTARLSSIGPDKEENTPWDIGYILKSPDTAAKKSDDNDDRQTWLEKRKAQLGLSEEEKKDKDSIEKTAFTGGQKKLDGPTFFWFFTALMLGAAVLFIPYAIFSKEKSYMQS